MMEATATRTAPEATMSSARRNQSLDCLKGMLVLFMAVYHAINYTSHYNKAFIWLAFLPPSFIFITGFLLTNIYTKKYDLGDKALHLRLLTRGGKLLALFTLLNVAVHALLAPGGDVLGGVSAFFSEWRQVYVSGLGRVAVFEVLLPIAYLLILSPVLLLCLRISRWCIPFLSAAAVGLCWFLEQRHQASNQMAMLSVGLLGMSIGSIPLPTLTSAARQLWLTAPLYGAYRVLSAISGETYLVQTLGVLSTLFLLLGLIELSIAPNSFFNSLVLMGKYSLLAYIAQIAFLQCINRFFGREHESWLVVIVLCVVTVAVSHLVAWCADRIRTRWSLANRMYNFAFA